MRKKEPPYTTIEEMQIYYICKALKKAKNNREKAAKMLGISPRSLYTKINLYELNDLK